MQNSQSVAIKIKEIAHSQNITISKMLSECDLNKNTLSTMQSRGYLPRAETIIKIADYLNCSVDYLLGRADRPDAIQPSDIDARNGTFDCIMTSSRPETTLLLEFRSLNPQGQEYILQTMDMVKDKYKKSDCLPQLEEIG